MDIKDIPLHRDGLMTVENKRRFSRIDFSQQANIKFRGTNYENCMIKDLSLTGMFVFGQFPQEADDKCLIKYSQTSATSHFYFKAAARVVRKNDEGIGIVFTSMPPNSYMLLETTLLYESQDPLSIGLQLPDNCPFEIIEELSEDPDENI
jgi:hypothetical protein